MENVVVRNFWPKDDITKKFIVNLVEKCTPKEKKSVITSVFTGTTLIQKTIETLKLKYGKTLNLETQQRRLYNLLNPSSEKNVLNIWYSGENLRPPSETHWDAILSFEKDDLNRRNIYLPFWATTFGVTIEEANRYQELLLQPRTGVGRRNFFACAVIGNPEPSRMYCIHKLQELGEIGLYGKIFNRSIKDKFSILQNYTFNICFENDLYPGYVTEKIFESWAAGCIPIWWGLDPEGFINKEAIIDFADMGFEKGISRIKELLANPSQLKQMQSEPILKKPYDFNALSVRLSEYLSYK